MPDAVVIGAGPNGLVAANLLSEAGWDTLVLEATPEPGGAVKSAELTVPGFTHDVFSAFYPFAAASPVIRGLSLENYGLVWKHAPTVLAHPTADGGCATLSMDLNDTCASLDRLVAGDSEGWRRLYSLWERVGDEVLAAMFTPFPPVAAAARVAAKLGRRDLTRFARFLTLPVRRLAEEEFEGPAPGLLLAGNALHTDVTPESVLSGFYGWVLCCLGQRFGFPVPEGGAGNLTAALVRRLEAHGGSVLCNARVSTIEVRGGTAVAARTADGRSFRASRAIVADVGAPQLFAELVAEDHLPDSLQRDLRRFQYDNATVKVDWALDGTIPWKAEEATRAGTVHVGESMDQLTEMCAQLHMQLLPSRPFLVMGQMTTADPSRSPAGTETAWAYAHVPQHPRGDAAGDLTGSWTEGETEAFVERMEEQVEALAPGFRDRVIGRHVMSPRTLEEQDANLVGGAINGGTAQLHQQLLFRPAAGLGGARTPIRNLYLGSASAHPGGGVHGAPGANAARAALSDWRRRRTILPAATGAAIALARRRRR